MKQAFRKRMAKRRALYGIQKVAQQWTANKHFAQANIKKHTRIKNAKTVRERERGKEKERTWKAEPKFQH